MNKNKFLTYLTIFFATSFFTEIALAIKCSDSTAALTAARNADAQTISAYKSAKCPLNITDRRGFTLNDIAAMSGRKTAQALGGNAQYSTALIKFIQTGMRYLNIDAGPIDGRMNNSTRAAIKVFQKKVGLAPTGNVSAEWLPHFYKQVAMQVQKELSRLGYSIGKADGVIGAGTSSAMRQFRKKYALAGQDYAHLDDQLVYQLMLATYDIDKKKMNKSSQVTARTEKTADNRQKNNQKNAQKNNPKNTQQNAQNRDRAEQAKAAQQKQQAALRREAEQAERRRLERERQLEERRQEQIASDMASRQSTVRNLTPTPSTPTTTLPPATAATVQAATTTAPVNKTTVPQVSVQAPRTTVDNSPAAQAIAAKNNAANEQKELKNRLANLEQEQQKVTAKLSDTAASSSQISSGGKKTFTTVNGMLSFSGGGCSIAGKKLDAAWCRNNASEAGKICDTVISSSGRVLSTRCK